MKNFVIFMLTTNFLPYTGSIILDQDTGIQFLRDICKLNPNFRINFRPLLCIFFYLEEVTRSTDTPVNETCNTVQSTTNAPTSSSTTIKTQDIFCLPYTGTSFQCVAETLCPLAFNLETGEQENEKRNCGTTVPNMCTDLYLCVLKNNKYYACPGDFIKTGYCKPL